MAGFDKLVKIFISSYLLLRVLGSILLGYSL